MDNFNYEGVTEAINSFDLLRSTPRQIAKKAVAAFLADNELLPLDEDAPPDAWMEWAEQGALEWKFFVRSLRAGGSDE